MRELLENFRREDELGLLTAPIATYLQDVVDHVLQTIALVDGLRDVGTSILEITLAIQNNRLGLVTKRVTGYAAMVAVPASPHCSGSRSNSMTGSEHSRRNFLFRK